MAKLNIPTANREGVSKLLALPSEVFAQLLTDISSQPLGIKLITRLPTAVTLSNVSSTDSEKILAALTTLHLVRASKDTILDEFVSDVAQAVEAFDSIGKTDESKRRLRSILQVEALVVSSKAFTIFLDQERALYATKILTDLRYAFQTDPSATPYGAVILHTLKVSYHQEGDHKEFLVGLDDDDLKTLKAAIDRAEAKAATLRKQLETAKVLDLSKG